MYFKPNFKMLVIGNSCSGKTYYVVKLLNDLLRWKQVLGNKKQQSICVICPNEASLKQPLWNKLESTVDKLLLKNNTPKPMKKYDYYIIDDVDALRGKSGEWIRDLFTIESHHTASTVIWLCHKYNTGSPESRASVDYLVLKDLDDEQVDKLPIDDVVKKKMYDHIRKQVFYEDCQYKNYSHLVYVKCCMPESDDRVYETDCCTLRKKITSLA